MIFPWHDSDREDLWSRDSRGNSPSRKSRGGRGRRRDYGLDNGARSVRPVFWEHGCGLTQ